MPRRLTVLAGSGDLVAHAVAAALAAGDRVQVLALAPRAPIAGTKHASADVSNPLGILWSLRLFRTTHIVMAGGVTLPDGAREGLMRFARGDGAQDAKATSVGDGELSGLARTIRTLTGAELVGVHEICPELLARRGPIAGPLSDAALQADAIWALGRARQAGQLDLGQALVASGRRLIALEDIGGTDDLIRRAGTLRAEGRTGGNGHALMLAKSSKPDQPLYVDLPAIGPETLRNCARAGITTIVVEADRTLVIEREAVISEAERSRITVFAAVPGDG